MNALYITTDTYYSIGTGFRTSCSNNAREFTNVPPEKIDIGFSYYSVLRTGTMKEELIAPCAWVTLSEAATLL